MKALDFVKTYVNPLFTRSYWQMLGDYVGIGKNKKVKPIANQDALAEFIASRASHVAQTSLYGYLRTRAGTRFPAMFENPDIVTSINIAKWHIWLACVSDLSIFAGQCLYKSGSVELDKIQQLVPAALQQVLDETGEPDEAGQDFVAAREKIVQRIKTCDWEHERDDDAVFSASPEALYYWSPIADELKEQDEAIVRNSIRFRWIEVRRSLRRLLDCEALAQNLR
ncbi:MAG: esterase [Gammaproteobacteria bacterium]|nr:esterase [Gammaproteobacteria bacterium]MDH3447626.1 esterase [Gammaproteobacteria bacterium]